MFPTLTRILNGFLNSLSSRSMKWIPRAFSCVFKMKLFIRPLLLLLQLGSLSNFVQSSGQRWSDLDVSCFLVNLATDHKYPSGGFSSNRVNCVKPVQEPDKSLDPSTFQKSSMRRSCITSEFVCVVLDTSNVFQWNGEWFFTRRVKLDSGLNVMPVNEVS